MRRRMNLSWFQMEMTEAPRELLVMKKNQREKGRVFIQVPTVSSELTMVVETPKSEDLYMNMTKYPGPL